MANPTAPREGDTATGTKQGYGIGVTSTGGVRADLIRIVRAALGSTASGEESLSGAVAVSNLEPQQDAPINISSSGVNSIVSAPGSGKRIAVHALVVIAAAAINFTLYSGTGTSHAKSGPITIASSGQGFPLSGGLNPLLRMLDNEPFVINVATTGGVQLGGFVSYTIQDAT